MSHTVISYYLRAETKKQKNFEFIKDADYWTPQETPDWVASSRPKEVSKKQLLWKSGKTTSTIYILFCVVILLMSVKKQK